MVSVRLDIEVYFISTRATLIFSFPRASGGFTEPLPAAGKQSERDPMLAKLSSNGRRGLTAYLGPLGPRDVESAHLVLQSGALQA